MKKIRGQKIVEETNNLELNFKYKKIRDFRNNRAAVCVDICDDYSFKKEYKELWGFVDEQLNEVIPCIYQEVEDLDDDFEPTQVK